MQGIGHQLGELFLGAVPTAVIILIFFLILRSLFFQPLLKVMAEREARTAGARREAEVAQAAAAEKERQYDEALKHALAQVYQEQEAARQKLARRNAIWKGRPANWPRRLYVRFCNRRPSTSPPCRAPR